MSFSSAVTAGPEKRSEEPDRRLARRGERRDPAGLAVPRQPDARAVDLRLSREEARRRRGVPGQRVDRARGRRLAGVRAARLADPALVVDEDGDAVPDEQGRELGQVGALRRARAVHEGDRGVLARARRGADSVPASVAVPLRKRTSSWRTRSRVRRVSRRSGPT